MNIIFSNKDLEMLYTTGKNRKYPLQPEVIKKFVKKVQIISSCSTLYDLWKYPGLNFEKYGTCYSIRIDYKFRLEFQIVFNIDEIKIETIDIFELSNHYGD